MNIRARIRNANQYLRYGERKELALKYGVKDHRMKDILSGRIKPTEVDTNFLDAVFDLAFPRMNKLKKFESF